MKKIISVVVVLMVVLLYFLYISYYHIDVTDYVIEDHKIKNEMNIVMIADVHDTHCKVKDKVVEKIKELNPNLILCVGDIIDKNSKNDEEVLKFLDQLTDISDVYMSLGNQELDFYKGKEKDLKKITDAGVHLLEEEYQDLEVHGNSIRLGGMYAYAFNTYSGKIDEESIDKNTYQFLKNMENTDSYKIMMAHRPDSFIFGEAKNWNFDLILSGHVHGGQVIVPFIGGLYAPDQGLFPKYDYGMFPLKDASMILTRGISSGHEKLPRLNNPVEIVNIVLKHN